MSEPVWTEERIATWRAGARTERSTMLVRTADFLSLLDELEESRRQAAQEREQCDRMTREAAGAASELERVTRERDAALDIIDRYNSLLGDAVAANRLALGKIAELEMDLGRDRP